MESETDRAFKQMETKKLNEDFDKLRQSDISKMSDKSLAKWQSKSPYDSPQYIIADREWQRRLMVEQIRGVRFAAYIGIIGTIIGSITTYLITKWP